MFRIISFKEFQTREERLSNKLEEAASDVEYHTSQFQIHEARCAIVARSNIYKEIADAYASYANGLQKSSKAKIQALTHADEFYTYAITELTSIHKQASLLVHLNQLYVLHSLMTLDRQNSKKYAERILAHFVQFPQLSDISGYRKSKLFTDGREIVSDLDDVKFEHVQLYGDFYDFTAPKLSAYLQDAQQILGMLKRNHGAAFQDAEEEATMPPPVKRLRLNPTPAPVASRTRQRLKPSLFLQREQDTTVPDQSLTEPSSPAIFVSRPT